MPPLDPQTPYATPTPLQKRWNSSVSHATFTDPYKSMQGQSKHNNCSGYSRSKGGHVIWTRQMQEKDLYLNSEKWMGLWKCRKERARLETIYRAGNELDIQGIKLWKWTWTIGNNRKKEGQYQNREVRNLCSILWAVESYCQFLVRWMKQCLFKLTCDNTQVLQKYLTQEN